MYYLEDNQEYVLYHHLTWRRPMSLYNAIVRFVLNIFKKKTAKKSKADHSLTSFFVNEKWMIYEAVAEGVKEHSFDEFFKHHKPFSLRPVYAANIEIKRDQKLLNLQNQKGKSYDHSDGIFFQLEKQITKTWDGATGEAALNDWYCSKLTAYGAGLPCWWEWSPMDLDQYSYTNWIDYKKLKNGKTHIDKAS